MPCRPPQDTDYFDRPTFFSGTTSEDRSASSKWTVSSNFTLIFVPIWKFPFFGGSNYRLCWQIFKNIQQNSNCRPTSRQESFQARKGFSDSNFQDQMPASSGFRKENVMTDTNWSFHVTTSSKIRQSKLKGGLKISPLSLDCRKDIAYSTKI